MCKPSSERKRERKEEGRVTEKSQTEQEAFGIFSEFLCVDCIAKHQRAERKLRRWSRAVVAALRYLFFTGILSL